MKARVAVSAACAVVIVSMSLQAHHGYADFKQDKVISVQGTLERVDWANPHTTLTIKSNATTYTAVWENRYHLHRAGVTLGSLKPGDWIIVNGHPNRDPEDHSLAQLREIRRPADGWWWAPGRVNTTSHQRVVGTGTSEHRKIDSKTRLEQLVLRLRAAKAPLEVIVIDGAC